MPLDLLVAAIQSALKRDRDISDNLLFHLSLADWLHYRRKPCWLLLLDLAGAYQNVNWGLLRDTMLTLVFREVQHVR
jgi:hypothetical protein